MTLDDLIYFLQDREIEGEMEIESIKIPSCCETDDLSVDIRGDSFSVFIED